MKLPDVNLHLLFRSMSYELKAGQIQTITNLSASQQYDHFLLKVVEHKELWTLKAANGFVLYDAQDSREIIPLWPHPEYARAMKRDGWINCSPYVISLNDFMIKWIPGMAKDGRLAGIFPSIQGDEIIVNSRALALDLREALKKLRNP